MNAREFVSAIRTVVMTAAVTDTISIAEKPPGRRPTADLTELSAWYNALADSDRAMVKRMLTIAARNAVFGLFAVLDGARKVDPLARPDDYFELRHVHEASDDVLSGPKGEPLHELL